MEQEPINAHSHLLSMMLGNSETIPVLACTPSACLYSFRAKREQLEIFEGFNLKSKGYA
jgi:hypothetical protein